MGKVIITFKIMPESPETDLEKIKKEIKSMKNAGEVKDFKEEPLAFGLKSLTVLSVFPDEGGIAEKAETALSKVKGVQSVEAVGVTLL